MRIFVEVEGPACHTSREVASQALHQPRSTAAGKHWTLKLMYWIPQNSLADAPLLSVFLHFSSSYKNKARIYSYAGLCSTVDVTVTIQFQPSTCMLCRVWIQARRKRARMCL